MTKDFLLTRTTLQRVSDILTDEIRLGFTSNEIKHSSLLCANTFVTEPPNGKEKGNFLSLDLGSSNFRVVLSKLDPDTHNEFQIKHYTVPTKLRRGDSKPVRFFKISNQNFLILHWIVTRCRAEMSFFEKFVKNKLLEIKLKFFFYFDNECISFNVQRRTPIAMMSTF